MNSHSARYSRRAALSLLTTSALVAFVAACGDSNEGGASSGLPDTINIVSINPMTGVFAYVGNSANNGYKLAIKEINEQKFLGDTKIELKFADTKSTSQTAAQELAKAIADRSISVVFGSVSSQDAVAMSPVAQKEGMPIVYTQAGSDGVIVGDYTYRATPLMREYYPNLNKYLKEQGWKTLGIIYNEAFPSLQDVGRNTLPEVARAAGIEVVASIGVPSTTQDFSAPISQILKARPDGVSILVSGAPLVTAMTQLRQAGYTGPVIGNPGAGGGTLKPAGKDGAGMVWPTDFHPDQSAASSQAFVKAYEAEYGEPPLNYAAEAYDAAWFVAKAIKKAQSADRKAIKDAMAEIAKEQFDGALGTGLRWQEREIRVPGVVVRWNGEREELLYEGAGQ